jgi:HSP20 family protein
MLKSLAKTNLPHRPLRDPFSEMRSLMNRFWEDFGSTSLLAPEWSAEGRFNPKIDLHESPEALEVTAELPGLEEKDIDLEVTKDALNIKGEKRFETEKKDKNCHFSERVYGSFYRSIPLPSEVDREKVEANFKQGLLKVRLPKTPAAKTEIRKISVKAEK